MKANKSRGSGCVLGLFGSVFAAVGLFMGGWLGMDIVNWSRVQGWMEVPAEVVSCELKVNSGSDSTTYQARGTYRYELEGVAYTGNRIGLNDTADNMGSWQHDRHQELKTAMANNRPIQVKVNPQNPHESYYCPDLRVSMVMVKLVFLLAFGGIGIAVATAGLWSKKITKRVSVQKKKYPGEAWKWNAAWADGEITSSGRGQVVFLWVFTVIWNAISWTVILGLWDELNFKNKEALFVFLFPAVGLLVLMSAIYSTMRYLKYGRIVFRMASIPGVLGGSLGGVVVVPGRLQPAEGFRLTLSCLHRYSSGSGKNRKTVEDVLWQDERTMKKDLMAGGQTSTMIPVLFALPYEGKESSPKKSSNCIIWRLQVSAKVPGVDLNSSFDVPVFKTEASRPDFVLDDSAIRPYSEPTDEASILEGAGLRILDAGEGLLELDVPARRYLKVAMGLAAFTIIWTGICVALWSFPAVPIFFAIVFSLFDVPLLWITLGLFFRSQSIRIGHGEARFRSGLFGGGRYRSAPVDRVKNLKSTRSMQSGNRQFFSIRADLPDKKNLTLISHLPSQRSIDAVLRVLQRALNDERPF